MRRSKAGLFAVFVNGTLRLEDRTDFLLRKDKEKKNEKQNVNNHPGETCSLAGKVGKLK